MKNKKIILTLVPSLYGGGAEKYVADISRYLSELYTHTTIIYNRKSSLYTYTGGLIDLSEPLNRWNHFRVLKQFSLLMHINRLKNQLTPRVVISHMLIPNIINLLSGRKPVTICFIHGLWSIRTKSIFFPKWFFRWVYSKADCIVCVSEYIEYEFQKYYNLDIHKKVIHIGVDSDKIRKLSDEIPYELIPQDYIVYVAGLREVKNHILLIETLKDFLKESKLSLVLIGDGPLKGTLETRIKQLGLDEKIYLLGNLKNPYPLVKRAKLAIMVSNSESFSLAVVEAMCLGVPIIATACGGPQEIIAPEIKTEINEPVRTNYGVLIPRLAATRENYLVSEIKQILSNEYYLHTLKEKGKKRAAYFSIRRSAEKLTKLVDTLASSR